MKNNNQATQNKSNRFFAQEMQQAFVEWVKKLPFITRASIIRSEQSKKAIIIQSVPQ